MWYVEPTMKVKMASIPAIRANIQRFQQIIKVGNKCNPVMIKRWRLMLH